MDEIRTKHKRLTYWDRKDIGKIDIAWGNEKIGLKHIRKRHFIEQDDFESYEDMAQKIENVLKYGKVERDKKDTIIVYNEMRLIVSQTVVYDEEDNFRDKHWILTSYDQSKSMKDKIRKAVSSETAFKRDQVIFNPNNSSVNSRKNHLERDQPSVDYSQCSLSLPKDTPYLLNGQQLMDEIIEKAKQGSPVGREKMSES